VFLSFGLAGGTLAIARCGEGGYAGTRQDEGVRREMLLRLLGLAICVGFLTGEITEHLSGQNFHVPPLGTLAYVGQRQTTASR
jgi:hypothetical protein